MCTQIREPCQLTDPLWSKQKLVVQRSADVQLEFNSFNLPSTTQANWRQWPQHLFAGGLTFSKPWKNTQIQYTFQVKWALPLTISFTSNLTPASHKLILEKWKRQAWYGKIQNTSLCCLCMLHNRIIWKNLKSMKLWVGAGRFLILDLHGKICQYIFWGRKKKCIINSCTQPQILPSTSNPIHCHSSN
jgi:hypothetical protein